MQKSKIDKLTSILRKLNKGENTLKLKKEVKEILASTTPEELSLAEQKLTETDLKPEDLRHLCAAHIELIEEKTEEIKLNLASGHVIHTLISEHDEILSFLNQLEKVNQDIQKIGIYNSKDKIFKKLKHISHHLIEAENHHAREEQILFPELEKRGIWGPPKIMKMDHEELKEEKRELKRLVKKANKNNFNNFKESLDSTVKSLVFVLREHIFKENNILYPTALDVIKDKKVWDKMKEEADKMGYCCFTPKR